MMGQDFTIGYCGWCAHNTEHGYYRKTAVAGFGHGLRRVLLGQRTYGPWYCNECRRVEDYLLAPVESNAVSSDMSQPTRVIKVPHAAEDTDSYQCRFTAKYRAAFSRRIIEGRQTFKQVSKELDVPKSELWKWVVEQYMDQNDKIEELTQAVKTLEKAMTHVDEIIPSDRLEVARFRQQWTTITVSSDETTNKGSSSNGSANKRTHGTSKGERNGVNFNREADNN